MINGKFFVLMLIVLPAVIALANYCDPSLCKPNEEHIACQNPSAKFAPICKNPRIMPMTQEIRDLILERHNMCRNKTAKGFHHFPPASRMDLMKWNDDLAYLAQLNVMQCEMKHDACRNTKRFPNSGQNLASSTWWNMNPTVADTVSAGIKSWFDEYKDCPADAIDKLYEPSHKKKILHFTAMIQERNTQLGCAALRCDVENQKTKQLFACNYAYNNMIGEPVYKRA